MQCGVCCVPVMLFIWILHNTLTLHQMDMSAITTISTPYHYPHYMPNNCLLHAYHLSLPRLQTTSLRVIIVHMICFCYTIYVILKLFWNYKSTDFKVWSEMIHACSLMGRNNRYFVWKYTYIVILWFVSIKHLLLEELIGPCFCHLNEIIKPRTNWWLSDSVTKIY